MRAIPDQHESGEGDEGLAILLVLFPLAIMALIIYLVIDNFDEIIEALKAIAVAVWKAHLWVGRAILFLVRDVILRHFCPDTASRQAIRLALILWFFVVPVVIGFCGFLTVVLILPTIAVLYGYYEELLDGPYPHYRWAQFMREYYLVFAELRLGVVRQRANVRRWLIEATSPEKEMES